EIIKQIMVRDFHLFVNRRELRIENEIFEVSQFFADAEQWKRIRSITSPSFTSGKLRNMHSLMDRCVNKLVDYFEKLTRNGSGVMETRKVIIGFTIDTIASTSFATDTNANDDRAVENPVVTSCLNMTTISPFTALSSFAMPLWFNNLVGVKNFLNVTSFNFLR